MWMKAPPLFPRKRNERTRRVVQPIVVTGPILRSASYEPSNFTLTLMFDRAVNVVGGEMNQETITIYDGDSGSELLNATEVYGSGTATLTITMFANAAWTGEGVRMTAGAGTGIVAASGGDAWGGVTNVILPYL